MKKYLSALLVTMLCVCCFGLAACGDSGSSSSAASSTASSAAPESSAATESSSAAADPSEKFVGDWKMAGLEMNGVTVIGDLSSMGVGTAALSIAADGTGKVTLDDDTTSFTWKQADENTLTIELENKSEDAMIPGAAKVTYQDDTVRLTINADDQEGTIIFSENGSIEGVKMLDMSQATDITSEDALIGTWKVSAMSYEGATMYGDSASLAAMNGSDEMAITFEAGGKATMLGSEAAWSIGENGAVVSDDYAEIAVKALGDDIIMNVGEAYGMEMYMRFSK